MCCRKRCLKSVNIAFVLFLWLMAIAELAVGTWVLLITYEVYTREQLIVQHYVFVPSVSIILFGVIILPLVLLACIGFYEESSYSINLYSTALIALSFLQVAAGMFCVMYFTEKNIDLMEQIKTTFIYSFESYKNYPKFVDQVQQQLKCCGINSTSDWTTYGAIPWSCCQDQYNQPISCTLSSTSLSIRGCVKASADFILFWAPTLGLGSIGSGVFEVLVAVMGYYNSRYFRENYSV